MRIVASESFNPNSYLAIKDAHGKAYKYYPFGNNHHVEILKSTQKNKKGLHDYKGVFVTTWEAAQRIRNHQKGRTKSYVQTDHGDTWQLHMVLCINDMVTVEENGEARYYRVQKLDPAGNRLVLRCHKASTLTYKDQSISASISTLIFKYKIKRLQTNVLANIGRKVG